jgi:tetratricopeptide (TPR) repeat protein
VPDFKRLFDVRRYRPLDVAIAGVGLVVLVLAVYLGLSVWLGNRLVVKSTPAERAIAAMVAAVRKNPNDINARMQLAQAFAVAGRDAEAVKQYEAVLSVNKDFTPAISGLGFQALLRKDWKQGEKYFRRVVDLLEPESGKGRDSSLEIAYYYLATALYEQGQYEEAVGYAKAAIRLRRDAADTHYLLANCYKKLEIADGYKKELETTLMFDPKMPEANYDYGLILLQKGDIAGAAEHFRTSADSAPNIEKPQDQLEKLGPGSKRLAEAKRLEKTEPAKALVEARIAAALEPNSVETLVLLGKLYEANKQPDKALEVYRRVLRIDPGNEDALAGVKRVENGS